MNLIVGYLAGLISVWSGINNYGRSLQSLRINTDLYKLQLVDLFTIKGVCLFVFFKEDKFHNEENSIQSKSFERQTLLCIIWVIINRQLFECMVGIDYTQINIFDASFYKDV